MLALETSFQTKKKYWFHIVLGESSVGDTPSKPCSEKKRKTFSILCEKCIFFNGNHQKSWLKMRYQIKNHIVSERANFGLSFHAFISILIFLVKIDFFEGGGP